MTDKTPWAGYINLALAQTVVGVNAVIGKYLADKVPLFLFICGRFFVGSVILLMFLKLSKESILIPAYANGLDNKLKAKEWTWLTAQALTGGLLFNLLFFGGLCFTTASSAGIISSTLPAMIAICAWIFLKESLSSRKIWAIILAMGGIFIISLDNGIGVANSRQGNFLGDGLILLAMFPEALFSIFGRLLGKRVQPLASAAIVTTICWLTTIPFGLYHLAIKADYGLSSWHVMLILFSGASTVIFYYCCNKGLAVVQAGISAVFGSLFPVSATILAWLFLDERLGMYDFIGMVVVLTSIVVGAELRQKGRSKIFST